MIIYLCTFFLSSLFIALSEKLSDRKPNNNFYNKIYKVIKVRDPSTRCAINENTVISFFLILLSLLLPVVIAAIRSPEIGTDVKYYVIPHFKTALNCRDFTAFSKRFEMSPTSEPLYGMILYFATRHFKSYHVVLFIYQTIIILFMYLGFRNFKKVLNVPIWSGMLLYYLMYFNVSLNIVRQSMAVSIVFYAVSCLFNGKNIKYFIFIVISFGLHGSGVLGLIFFPMYIFLRKKDLGLRYRDIRKLSAAILIILTGLLCLDRGVRMLVSLGIVRPNMLNYLSGGRFSSNYLSPVSVGIYSILLFAYIVHIRYIAKKPLELNFYVIVSIIMLLGSFGSLISLYISRVCYYFIPLHALALSSIQNCYKKSEKYLWMFSIISFVFLTWVVFFVIKNNHSTYPYMVDQMLFSN